MIRDTLKTKKYFDKYIERDECSIEKYKKWISEDDGTDPERIRRLKNAWIGKLGRILVARYSRGDSLEELKPFFDEYLNKLFSVDEEPSPGFAGELENVSLATLFNKPVAVKEKIASTTSTKDGLLAYVSSEKLTNINPHWKGHKVLLDAVVSRDKVEQSRLLKSYVDGWYKSKWNKDFGGYGSDKTSSLDNMDFSGYNGYWCWEAGAVAKLAHIDDDNLKNHPNYPYDLVHFKS